MLYSSIFDCAARSHAAPPMPVPPRFSGPLYEQVHELLRGRIVSGEWGSGAPLPGEVELSRELSVSIGTVRKAMDKLASERLIVRERGRGTFALEPTRDDARLNAQICDALGEPVAIIFSVIEVLSRAATPEETQVLRCRRSAQGLPRVHQVRRHWHRGERLVCRELITVDGARFPNLTDTLPAPTETYFDHYSRKFGIKARRTSWALAPTVVEPFAPGGSAERLPSLDLTLQRVAYDAEDAPFELCVQELSLRQETYHLT